MSSCSRLLRLAPVFRSCASLQSCGNIPVKFGVCSSQQPIKCASQFAIQCRNFQAFTPARLSQFEIIKELSEDEKTQVQELRKRIEDILPRFKNDHARNDLNLYKFLKAKDFDLDKTEEMIRKHIEWRTEKEMDTILDRRVPAEIEHDYAFKVTGFDKYGYPIVISNLGRWELKKTLDKDLKEAFLTYILQMFEQAVEIGETMSTPENYVGQMHLIFDMEGFGLRHLAQPDVIQAVQEMIRMLQDNYPGSTIGVQIIQAPMTFQFLWSIIQGTLTERTRKKTHIISGSPEVWKPALLESIDPDNLPSQYGGAINTCFDYKLELGINSIPVYEVIPEEEMTSAIIPPGGSLTEDFTIERDAKLSWNFKSATHPVQFRVTNAYDGDIVCAHEVSSHSFVQKGLITSEAGGKYTLEFVNNSSSRETLKYAVRIH